MLLFSVQSAKNVYFLHETSNFTPGAQMALSEIDNSSENDFLLPWLLCHYGKNMMRKYYFRI